MEARDRQRLGVPVGAATGTGIGGRHCQIGEGSDRSRSSGVAVSVLRDRGRVSVAQNHLEAKISSVASSTALQ